MNEWSNVITGKIFAGGLCDKVLGERMWLTAMCVPRWLLFPS